MYDVVSVGEIVIDFLMCGKGPMGNPAFEMNPGGAPANVVVASAALGAKNAFIGMVGDDLLGRFLIKTLPKFHVDSTGMMQTKESFSNMTFVDIDEDGDRFFNIVGKGTDYLLNKDTIDYSIIDQAKIVHTPIGVARKQPGYDALFGVLEYARKKGKIISYDPNFRPGQFPTMEMAKELFCKGLEYSDLVKVSEEEMSIITGLPEEKYEEGAKRIFDMGKTAVFVTMGGKGAYYITKDEKGFVPGFQVDTVDTTGCGDCFMGSVHYYLTHDCGFSMGEIVRRANAAGALCATKRGAFDAMPTLGEVEAFLKTRA